MTKIAYKTITDSKNPNLPVGFIVDHFETNNDVEEGYIVVSKEMFDHLFKNNVELMRAHESNKGVVNGVHPHYPIVPPRPNHEAEPVDQAVMAQRKKEIEDKLKAKQEDMLLFKQFLEWKKSQTEGS